MEKLQIVSMLFWVDFAPKNYFLLLIVKNGIEPMLNLYFWDQLSTVFFFFKYLRWNKA